VKSDACANLLPKAGTWSGYVRTPDRPLRPTGRCDGALAAHDLLPDGRHQIQHAAI